MKGYLLDTSICVAIFRGNRQVAAKLNKVSKEQCFISQIVVAGPLIINSGFRNSEVNQRVGGVRTSQHLLGQAADIRPQDPSQFWNLVEFLKICEHTDQLLTGNGWLHISWNPLAPPRHYIRVGYYK